MSEPPFDEGAVEAPERPTLSTDSASVVFPSSTPDNMKRRPEQLADDPRPRTEWSGTCQWIEGEPSRHDRCKCGRPARVRGAWCDEHYARVWQSCPEEAGGLAELLRELGALSDE